MKNYFQTAITLTFLMLFGVTTYAQKLRVFMDAPSVYLVTTDIENVSQNLGLGADLGIGFGTHNIMLKISGGAMATTDIESEEIGKATFINPFVQSELGVGLWRTNNKKCSRTEQSALSLLAKGGIIYAFGKRDADEKLNLSEKSAGHDYFAGIEFSTFRLRDSFKNTEFFVDGGYFFTGEAIYAKMGFRMFLKLSQQR